MSRSAGAAYLSLTHIGDGDVDESFSTEDFFDGVRSVAKTQRVSVTKGHAVPGALDLHLDPTGALIGIEAHDAARQLPLSLLDAAGSARP